MTEADPPALTEAQAHVLQALRDGAELRRHERAERGPYYTLAGRRLSMPLLKALEGRKLVQRSGTAERGTAAYVLTLSGETALDGWTKGEAADTRPVGKSSAEPT